MYDPSTDEWPEKAIPDVEDNLQERGQYSGSNSNPNIKDKKINIVSFDKNDIFTFI